MSWLNEATEKRLEELFDLHVPSMGSSETHGGECIRAVTRVAYRYFNDGDYYFEGYGCETCGDVTTFLKNYTNSEIKDLIKKDGFTYGDSYEEFLNKLALAVIAYAETQFETPLITDCQAVKSEWEDESEPDEDEVDWYSSDYDESEDED